MNYIYGINAVTEALKARGRAFQWVGMAKERHDIRLQRMIEDCRKLGVPVRFLTRVELDRMAGNAAHQGVVAVTSAKQYSDLDERNRRQARKIFFSHRARRRGRSTQSRRSPAHRRCCRRRWRRHSRTPRRAGDRNRHQSLRWSERILAIARVTNIARTIEDLKERNIWTVGLDERSKQTYDALDYNMDCALVLGAEGKGLHDLVKKKCDFLVSIPMLGKVPSLNVSVAGAVVMYEIVRQRRAHDRDTDDRDKDDKDKHKDRNKNEEASVGGR